MKFTIKKIEERQAKDKAGKFIDDQKVIKSQKNLRDF